MPADQSEIKDAEQEVDSGADNARKVVFVEIQRHQGDESNDPRDPSAPDANQAAVRPLDVWQPHPEEDEREALHEVGDDSAEDRHVEQGSNDLAGYQAACYSELVNQDRQGTADGAAGDQCDVGRLRAGMRDRQELRKVPGP